METYKPKRESYEVFSANMTIDTRTDVSSAKHLAACKSCQCACHLCRGHMALTGEGILSKVATEKVLEALLAA